MAVGFINGTGSVGAIIGSMIPGFVHGRWGWHGVLVLLSLSSLVAGCVLLLKWNVLPPEGRRAES